MNHDFDSIEFQNAYHTQAPLGAFYTPESTLFRLWAPTAQRVELRLYKEGKGDAAYGIFSMAAKEKGTWEFECPEDLKGIYYDFALWVDGEYHQGADPYGKGCGVNGLRSMVVDLSATNPENWEKDTPPAKTPEQIIYELHIKDFSWDSNGGFAQENRGKFRAFTQKGTTLRGEGQLPTGMDYLRRLGITHVQILPMYDYGSVDEENPEGSYNWGYDPMNYNVPEGSYATDPYRGEVRIRELKEMIAALHANGFRVIMDVVYNHTYSFDCGLFRSAPWYFYRRNSDGTASNGSGCGNDVATERSMCARYILDSVLYWAEEYHIDGFRFDLMGLLDTQLMERLQKALDERYGEGEKLLYGEPWRAGNTVVAEGVTLCDKGALKKINGAIGAFCDDTRDRVKGSVMDENSVGFANGGSLCADELVRCVAGWAGEYGSFQTPNQTITYLSCHDDWTLWDKLVYTMDPKKDFTGSSQEIKKANRLAAAIYLSCQGRIFIHAGEEFGRTKGGIKNSYRSSPEINQLDWKRAWENADLVDYYRGLIALRKQLPGLQDKSRDAGSRILEKLDIAPNCAGIALDNRGEGSQWDKLLLCFNCSIETAEFALPEGSWQILVDGENAFRWEEDTCLEGMAQLPPQSALIVGKKRK